MKAVIVSSFGDSNALQVVDRAEPAPGPGQVLIRVEAAGVGYVDVMARNGDYQPLSEPGFVPGFEAAGTVAAVGAAVDEHWVGQRVFALTRSGAYAESVVADPRDVVRLPEGVSAADAVALGVNALVASLGLKRVNVEEGEQVLVRGAGGGIGLMAAQLAALSGGAVTAITSSPERGDRLRGLGVAHIQDRTAGQDGSADTYDIIVDPVAGVDLGRYIGMLRPNGRYLLVGSAGGAAASDVLGSIMTTYHNSPTLFAFSLNSVDADMVGAAAAELFGQAVRGDLRAIIDEQIPLAEAHRAHERLESTPVFGKITLHP
ncbi:zinc-binding dehydrogenase [Streptomyces sp. NBC_01795]|uniref:quinone oxidoreductase family protein n=1 Tax=Streptomyces sp. NBC_01795 TaxID=2975943 RepID=UPI002DDB4AC1|nr:zinc-binding dehydrogenase [Streptomyces sp. NBC_01795]WSA91421.1 zinc-binding dehydrogenase [Streptomyces sp. NBC_01795]